MRIILTGSHGFVGATLAAKLRAGGHNVVGIDRTPGADLIGDIGDAALIAKAFAGGCDAVAHLATVPGGAAELDPAAAKRVNLDATMMLAEAAAKAGARFVFASSIAVFGEDMPPAIDDATPAAPRLLYGAHKAMVEQWLETLNRRGDLSSLSLRLPGIVARPPGPSGMKSAFMSEIFHALAAGRPYVLPVSPEATLLLMSADRVASNLQHALTSDAIGTLTLPALRITMAALAAEIATQTGADPGLIGYDPDPHLEAGFGKLPPLRTPAAEALGFGSDASLAALVTKGLGR